MTPLWLRRASISVLFIAITCVVAIAGIKYFSIKEEAKALAHEVAIGPAVRLAKVVQSAGEHTILLIGETRPYESATLYAKVSGYLKDIRADKGDVVQKGQVLAVIESPETDQAYAAAQSNAKNKRDIAGRMAILLKQQLVSEQEAEQAQSDSEVAAANYQAQSVLKGYEIIRAPFSGTVTARYADPGALVQNAMNSQASALPLLMVSDIKRLRVDIFLDQRDAPFVHKGDAVEITLSEGADVRIAGSVSRVSEQLDPRTKMMLVEIDISNSNAQIVAGSFVNVKLTIKSRPYLEVPVEGLVLMKGKSHLSLVTPKHTLIYRPVEIANNNGKVLWIASGVEEGEMVALGVGDAIPENSPVRPLSEPVPAVRK